MTSEESDPFHSLPECYIETSSDLERFADSIVAGGDLAACSIDTEADSMHSYETKLCLIQFSVPSQLAIIDPLAIGLENLGRFTSFIDQFDTVWMHGADYDISMFKMTFDWVPKQILDTQIAARLLGSTKFGLANLLEAEYGVRLSKQSQKADWSKRPLSEKMLDYAYNDVRYLLDLGGKFRERLIEIERDSWFLESCDAARTSVMQRDDRSMEEAWRISGWGKLSARGLNYLKHLCKWRDQECSKLDRPAFKFLGNRELFRMVQNLEQNRAASPPHYIKPHYVKRLNEAIAKADAVPESDYPSKRVKGNGLRLEIDENKFEKIRKIRNRKADELGIEGTMIATRFVMEKLASSNLSSEEKLDGLQNWQQELLQSVIED